MPEEKKALLGMSLYELREAAKSLSMPAFAGGQIARWIYGRHVSSIDDMTDISKANRDKLRSTFDIGCRPPIESCCSADGTVKYLFPTSDGKSVETVYIPEGDRATVCVSSQVGCKMGCIFCRTGKQGFNGNLSATDILNQIYSLPERDSLTNIVFMGQGEPMDNIDNVLQATEILTANYGYAWSPKRITVSSVGVRRKLKRFLDESECHVAISMHSPFHEQRAQMMPAEKAMPMAEVIDLLRDYDFSHQRRLSFEYIVFDGINDTEEHLKEIIKLTQGLHCRVNLIKYHKIPDVEMHAAGDRKMEFMRTYLSHHGVFSTIRMSRGKDIAAACGMLNTAHKTVRTRQPKTN